MVLLNVTNEIVGYTGGFSFPILLMSVAGGAFMALQIFVFILSDDWYDRISSSVTCLLALCVTIVITHNLYKFGGEPIIETHYQVLFTSEEALQDALNDFEIIDNQGRIFTLKEKTADTN